jgi:hypothetical protein
VGAIVGWRSPDSSSRATGHRDQSVDLPAVSLEAEMLAHIRAGVAHHNASCPMPARAILLNSGNYELFGWDELFGLPVEPRDEIPPKRFRIDCPGSAYGIEEEIAEAIGEEVPARAV